jgi:GTP-binding protein
LIETQVYKNILIGVHSKPDDMMINVCRTKQLTNMRVSGTDGIMQLESPLELNLDIAMEYIQEDELVEVTPLNIRMMKNIDYIKSNKKR